MSMIADAMSIASRKAWAAKYSHAPSGGTAAGIGPPHAGEERDAVDVRHDLDQEQPDERQPGEEFDPEVAAGERRLAEPAPAAEAEVADERQVVREPDRPQARPAPRPRPEDAPLERQPGDQDVQKAADRQPEHEHPQGPDDERNGRTTNSCRGRTRAVNGRVDRALPRIQDSGRDGLRRRPGGVERGVGDGSVQRLPHGQQVDDLLQPAADEVRPTGGGGRVVLDPLPEHVRRGAAARRRTRTPSAGRGWPAGGRPRRRWR